MATKMARVRPGGRSAKKRQDILNAARRVFLECGYDATSMDDIAAAAAVSKPTIYQHFGDKHALFAATISVDIAAAESGTQALIDALPATQDLRRDLRRFARAHVSDVMQPNLVRMRRRLIGEAERFPDLAATWFENGPARGHRTLASVFAKLADRGLLDVVDPLIAAEQFNWLVLIPLNRAMFITDPWTPSDLHQAADQAVELFLRAYGTPSSARGRRR